MNGRINLMQKTLFMAIITALVMVSPTAFAKEYIIKQISDPAGKKPYYFSPNHLTIQTGDTVHFVNAQDDMHDVMFVEVPKGVNTVIMSPMHEKEGDRFTYRFVVPGTYKFHCHPHEGLDMQGTLIVGKPSKAGETMKMNHHAMAMTQNHKAHAEQAPEKNHQNQTLQDGHGIEATGKVNHIDPTNRTITITHDPIQALSWPKMKMVFSVAKDINFSDIKVGDSVIFSLKQEGEDNYVIVMLNKTP
jgi:plastocyanin/Cu/Ag efflux protein CusF